MTRPRHVWLWWGLAVAVGAWLLWMTLRPNQTVATDLAPLTEPASRQGIPPHLLIQTAGNLAVFVPLGTTLALALAGMPRRRRLLLATLAGGALSLAIELAQTAIPSRVPGVNDWLLNTAGTGLGALVGCAITRYRSRLSHVQKGAADDRPDY